jgi:hypothetical protein
MSDQPHPLSFDERKAVLEATLAARAKLIAVQAPALAPGETDDERYRRLLLSDDRTIWTGLK